MINSKYFRVPKKKEPLEEHEIHLTSKQDPINFLKYAIFLFEKKNLPYIKFKASGSAIAGLVNISEILKKVVPGVHQINRIYTLKYEQDYEPKEKGLDHVTIVRNVPILEISFYKELPNLDMENLPGFQRALKPEIFERVRINFNNVIRKRNTKGGNGNEGSSRRPQQNNFRDNQSRSTYGVGFRGGHSQRGGSVSSGFRAGFRGGRGGSSRGGFGNRPQGQFQGNRDQYQGNRDQYQGNRNPYQGGNRDRDQYQGTGTGLKSGFRGGRGGFRGGFRGGNQGGNNVTYNDFSQGNNFQEGGNRHQDGYSEHSRGQSIRGFPKYRSKFDNQTRK